MIRPGYCSYKEKISRNVDPSILADYCWNVVRDKPAAGYKRQAKKRRSDTE